MKGKELRVLLVCYFSAVAFGFEIRLASKHNYMIDIVNDGKVTQKFQPGV